MWACSSKPCMRRRLCARMWLRCSCSLGPTWCGLVAGGCDGGAQLVDVCQQLVAHCDLHSAWVALRRGQCMWSHFTVKVTATAAVPSQKPSARASATHQLRQGAFRTSACALL